MSPSIRSSAARAAARVAAAWVATTAVWAGCLAVAFQQLNHLQPLDLPALYGFWWVVYLMLTAPAALIAFAITIAIGRASWQRAAVIGVVTVGGLIVASVLVSRWGAAYRAVATLRVTPVGLLDAAAVAVAWALGILGAERIASGARRIGVVSLAVLVALLGATHLINVRYERPTRVDLAADVAPHVVGDPACSPHAGPIAGLTLLALDGMTWTVTAPLLQQGRMPNLARLLGRSSYGHLDTMFPSYSPVVWATIATGLREEDHGIHGFLRTWLPGVSGPIATGPKINGMVWVGATDWLLAKATDLGWGRAEPQPSTQRKAHALWEVAGANGYEMGVYDYMNTWPVEPVRGYMYSHVGQPPSNAWPAELLAVLDGVHAPSDGFTNAHLLQFAQHYAEALELARTYEPTVALHFNKVMDGYNEFWWPPGKRFYWPKGPPYTTSSPDVEIGYELTDVWLGRFMAALPPGHVLVIASDHGYEFNATHQAFSPPGVIVLSGGPFACGKEIHGARVFDVLPTVLALLGLPGLERMPGHVLEDAFAVPPPTLERIAEYPADWRRKVDQIGHGDWEDLREELRALGYVQ